jgi:hypothetical protein
MIAQNPMKKEFCQKVRGSFQNSGYLPKPSIIPDMAKTEDMTSISSMGICGEGDFGDRGMRKSIKLRGKAGILLAGKDSGT